MLKAIQAYLARLGGDSGGGSSAPQVLRRSCPLCARSRLIDTAPLCQSAEMGELRFWTALFCAVAAPLLLLGPVGCAGWWDASQAAFLLNPLSPPTDRRHHRRRCSTAAVSPPHPVPLLSRSIPETFAAFARYRSRLLQFKEQHVLRVPAAADTERRYDVLDADLMRWHADMQLLTEQSLSMAVVGQVGWDGQCMPLHTRLRAWQPAPGHPAPGPPAALR